MPGETIPCGNGMTEAVRASLRTSLHAVVPAMFKAQQPWALMGSSASVLQGIPDYEPPDIDFTTTMEGAYIMQGAIAHNGVMVRPVSYSVRDPYASYFGVFEIDGVKTEVMGDLVIKCEDGLIDVKDHWSRWSDKVRVLHFETLHVPVIPLEWQLVANTLLKRPERISGIVSFLRDHGFDRPYLCALLDDRQLGERTIGAVRKAMNLD
jgi:hypothetical protein